MRMGTDPAASVVNPEGEAHEVERLFVADSSVAPADGGANPTLTAQANVMNAQAPSRIVNSVTKAILSKLSRRESILSMVWPSPA